MRTHYYFVAAGLGVLTFAWLYFVAQKETHSNQPVRSLGEQLTAKHTPPIGSSISAVITKAFVPPDQAGQISFRTIDANGAPVEGTRIFVVGGPSRRLLDASLLGRTSSAGELESVFSDVLAIASMDSLSGRSIDAPFVYAWNEGFIPAEVGSVECGREYAITLHRGHALQIEFQDRRREPVTGVTVQISRAALGLEALNPESVAPAGAGSSAVWQGTSDKLGIVTIDGIPPGVYIMRIDSATHVALNRLPISSIQMPADRPLVIMAQAFAVVGEVSGDRILFSRISYGYDSNTISGVTNDSDVHQALETIDSRLKKRFPSATIRSIVLTDEQVRDGTTVSLVAMMITEHAGVTSQVFRARPVGSIAEPEVIVVPRSDGDYGTRRVRVDLVTPSGATVPPIGFFLISSVNGERIRWFCKGKGDLNLPHGSYRLSSFHSLCRGILAQNEEIIVGPDSPIDIRVRLRREVKLYQFDIDGGLGSGVYARWSLIVRDIGRMGGVGAVREFEALLPEGTVELHVDATGFAYHKENFVVNSEHGSGDGLPVVVTRRLAPK